MSTSALSLHVVEGHGRKDFASSRVKSVMANTAVENRQTPHAEAWNEAMWICEWVYALP